MIRDQILTGVGKFRACVLLPETQHRSDDVRKGRVHDMEEMEEVSGGKMAMRTNAYT